MEVEKSFASQETGLVIPTFDPTTTEQAKLGHFAALEECPLEAFNRVYCMLRYLQYVVSSKTYWKTRFGSPDWNQSNPIQKAFIPGWMRPKEAKAQVTTLQDLFQLSNLSAKTWKISWKRGRKIRW